MGCQTCFLMVSHAIMSQISNCYFCAISSGELSVCAIFAFFPIMEAVFHRPANKRKADDTSSLLFHKQHFHLAERQFELTPCKDWLLFKNKKKKQNAHFFVSSCKDWLLCQCAQELEIRSR